jgi:organic hydroperoxide reductase OsmC/OhrA
MRTYKGYDRTWQIATAWKPVIDCSNDPLLGGDPTRPNPEDLLLASLSACHMPWYLHLAAQAGIVVCRYQDDPLGTGEQEYGERTLPRGSSAADDRSSGLCRPRAGPTGHAFPRARPKAISQ